MIYFKKNNKKINKCIKDKNKKNMYKKLNYKNYFKPHLKKC